MAGAVVPPKNLTLSFIPGSGRMGFALARRHALSGFNVVLGARNLQKANDNAVQLRKDMQVQPEVFEKRVQVASSQRAAALGDVIFWVAGPTGSLCKSADDLAPRYEYLQSLRSELKGKVVVDCTNIMYALPERAWGQTSSLLRNIEQVPEANWVCGWKHVFFTKLLAEAPVGPAPSSVIICGDDKAAKSQVISIVDCLPGFKGLDGGEARHSKILELLGPKWLQELEAWNFPDNKYQCGWTYGP